MSIYISESTADENDAALFGQDVSNNTFWQNLLLGYRFLRLQPTLRAVVAQLSVFMILTGSIAVLIVFHLKHDLGITNEVAGIMFGLGCIGGIVAGLGASKLQKTFGFGACWIGGLSITGLAITVSVLSTNVVLLTLIAICFKFGRVLSVVTSATLLQEITPDRILGRVSSAFWLISTSPAPLGAALASVLADRIGSVSVFLMIGVLVVLVSILALFTPARLARPAKEAGIHAVRAEYDIALEQTPLLKPDGLSMSNEKEIYYTCFRCGAAMPAHANYCGNCGQSLLKTLTLGSLRTI